MTKKALIHILILFVLMTVAFFWVSDTLLSNYSLQATAVLIIALVFAKRMVKMEIFKLIESSVTVIAVLLLISGTGGISSPLFFLNYFLLFVLSLLLEPAVPLVLSILLIVFYLLTNEIGTSYFRLLELLAFPFMTPLAYFTGKIYQKEENQKKEIKNLTHKVEELEEELVEEEIGSNDSKSVTQ
jgi:K+-sensing histidine kinase KdpD